MGREISITVNGTQHTSDVEPRQLLVEYIRDTLNLTGTHVGCDTSGCGACTVILNGSAVKSCTIFAVQADGGEVTTIEGLASNGDLHPTTGRLLGNARPPVRILHTRHDHVLSRPAREEPQPVGRGNPERTLRQLLPLHRLSQHRKGRAVRRRQDVLTEPRQPDDSLTIWIPPPRERIDRIKGGRA